LKQRLVKCDEMLLNRVYVTNHVMLYTLQVISTVRQTQLEMAVLLENQQELSKSFHTI